MKELLERIEGLKKELLSGENFYKIYQDEIEDCFNKWIPELKDKGR